MNKDIGLASSLRTGIPALVYYACLLMRPVTLCFCKKNFHNTICDRPWRAWMEPTATPATEYGIRKNPARLDAACDRVWRWFWGLLSKMVFNAFLSQISDFISWACLSSWGSKCSESAACLPARPVSLKPLINQKAPLKKKEKNIHRISGTFARARHTTYVTHCRAGPAAASAYSA